MLASLRLSRSPTRAMVAMGPRFPEPRWVYSSSARF